VALCSFSGGGMGGEEVGPEISVSALLFNIERASNSGGSRGQLGPRISSSLAHLCASKYKSTHSDMAHTRLEWAKKNDAYCVLVTE
jgi:hypothetical protein